MNEYAKIIKKYINDYDYFIGLRSDIDIMFPFPEKELFEKIPHDVYTFLPNYSKSWGGQGLPNFFHKKYILDTLTCYYDYIKDNKNIDYLFNCHDISDFCNYNNFPIKKFINQELLLLIALKEKNITMKNITNTNFYYTGNNINDRTTSTELKYYNNTEKICKYNEQVNETLHNLKLWENNYRWEYEVDHIGFKDNGNSIMANIALVGLKYLYLDNERRREIAKIYSSLLSSNKSISIISHKNFDETSQHLFQIITPNRNLIMQKLSRMEIGYGVHYKTNTSYPMYKKFKTDTPTANLLSDQILSLPLFLDITESEQTTIAKALEI
jgi:hypothetical protein